MTHPAASDKPETTPARGWRGWWRRQSQQRQDRMVTLAPLAAVVLFLAAIVSAFWYLRLEEIGREQEAVKRDVEYAQQRLRLRLIEQQEQLARLARELSNREIKQNEFVALSRNMVVRYPEMLAMTWVDETLMVRSSYASPSMNVRQLRDPGEELGPQDVVGTMSLLRDLRQPVFSRPVDDQGESNDLQLHVPLYVRGRFAGLVIADYSIDGLLRHGVPPEVSDKYAVALMDQNGRVLAGNTTSPRAIEASFLPWSTPANEYAVPVSPLGSGLLIRAQAYRTSLGVVGTGLFWLVSALSILTSWMLLVTWRHTQQRMRAQRELMSETNFRRAMENSMLTGMRALDMQGRITYVNQAFCQMTGWSEAELIGRSPPFPYWPDEERATLQALLDDELAGRSTQSGFQLHVKRKDGSLFDARMYVSPLVDAQGQQAGWMASMTDITEPNRIRLELSASHQRFTTVLESLDAAVSVAPLAGDEMLFTNKLYRLWFGTSANGHLNLVQEADSLPLLSADAHPDAADPLAGLPTDPLTEAQAENAEVFVTELQKWLEVRTRYLTWVDGRLAQMVIASDITPRRLAEEQAAEQAKRVEATSRLMTMGEMASSVAHELNQPLTAIANYCNGMISRLRGNQINTDEMLGALEKTSRQAQRAGQVIQRIRSFVKRSEPNRSETEIGPLVNEAIELAGIELRRRNIGLRSYVAARLPRLRVERLLIEQVLINLLKNAAESVDACQRPGLDRSVELQVVPRTIDERVGVEFSVVDTGGGMSPEVEQRLFEAFYTTKSEGMGIGLSLCRSIVESHQGRMQAQNLYNVGEVTGCRFSFWIPVTDERQLDDSTTNRMAA